MPIHPLLRCVGLTDLIDPLADLTGTVEVRDGNGMGWTAFEM